MMWRMAIPAAAVVVVIVSLSRGLLLLLIIYNYSYKSLNHYLADNLNEADPSMWDAV